MTSGSVTERAGTPNTPASTLARIISGTPGPSDFEVFWRHYRGFVARHVGRSFRKLGFRDPADEDKVTGQVLSSLYLKRAWGYRVSRGRFRQLLLTVIKRLCIDHLRAKYGSKLKTNLLKTIAARTDRRHAPDYVIQELDRMERFQAVEAFYREAGERVRRATKKPWQRQVLDALDWSSLPFGGVLRKQQKLQAAVESGRSYSVVHELVKDRNRCRHILHRQLLLLAGLCHDEVGVQVA